MASNGFLIKGYREQLQTVTLCEIQENSKPLFSKLKASVYFTL